MAVPNTNPPEYVGLDVDLCRAIAAALFDGNADAVEMVQTTGTDRWTALINGQADVVMRSTHTADRDVHEASVGVGLSFSTPYYYDGLTLGGIPQYAQCASRFDTKSPDCTGVRICVQGGTTHEDIIRQAFVHYQDADQVVVVVVPDQSSLYHSFKSGVCNVVANERFNISPKTMIRHGYEGPYEIPEAAPILSKEPLAVVTRQDDATWSDFVEWIVQALMEAEEQGVTQATANQMKTTTVFGVTMANMFENAIAAVGNYGELYAYVHHVSN